MNKHEVHKRLKELKVRPQKKLGQNFLINEALAHQMVQSLTDLNPQKIIEIGPGLGSLTELLLPLKIPLTLVEVDPVFCQYWKKRGCHLIPKNALKIQIDETCSLIGSLPFHIANSLVLKSCMEWNVENMVLMVQKEVGDRIVSPCQKKNYGLLSVISQCFWNIKFLTDVQRDDFFPPPQVKGRVLTFYKKNSLSVDSHSFLKFVKICFSQKRKFLKKKLFQFYDRPQIEGIFEQMGWASSLRAEELKPQEYLKFFSLIQLKT